MSNDRWYNPGDNYILDDLSGFKIRASRAKIIPGGQTGGLAVAPERWEAQQPQDKVRGIVDDQTVSLVRSRQKNQFVILGTWVTAPSARGESFIEVDDAVGFNLNDNIQIMLDSGENFVTSIAGFDGDGFWLGAPLPASVGTLYGDPIENMVLFLSPAPPLTTGFWNDGGVLAMFASSGYPLVPGAVPGSVWCNGLTVGVVPGVTPDPGAPPMIFGVVTTGFLLLNGGGDLPLAPTSSLRLYNNGGVVCVT